MFKRNSKIYWMVILIGVFAAAGILVWDSNTSAEDWPGGVLIAMGSAPSSPKTVTISNRTKYTVEVTLFVEKDGLAETADRAFQTKTMEASQGCIFTTPRGECPSGLMGRIRVGAHWLRLIPTNMLGDDNGPFTKACWDSGWTICRIRGVEPTVHDDEIGFCKY